MVQMTGCAEAGLEDGSSDVCWRKKAWQAPYVAGEKKIHSTVIEGVGNFAADHWPGACGAAKLTHMRYTVRHCALKPGTLGCT